MRLQTEREHPHGLSDAEFDALFTTDRPIIFAYHGYPWLIHRLTYRRTNHANLHVRGYKEEGTTTTPFDMVMLNDLDRFHLVMDVIDRVPGLGVAGRPRAPADGRQAARGARRTRGARARTCRRSATGPGRASALIAERVLVVNAGRRRLKLSVLDADGRATGARTLETVAGCARAAQRDRRELGGARAGRRRRAPRRPRRRRLPRPGGRRRRRSWPASESLTALAPLHQPRSLAALDARPRPRCRTCPHVACFDTAFHATLPAAASTYAIPRDWRERWPLRRYGFHGLSHAYASRSGGGAPRPAGRGPADRHVPPRRGRVAGRRRGRRVRRHDDGLHAARGAGDGDPVRERRPRARALAPDRGRPVARRRSPTASSTTRAWSAWPARRTCAASSHGRRPATPMRRSRSTSTSTGCARGSRRWPRRWAASTRSRSPAGSASTPPRSVAGPSTGSGSSASRSTPPATTPSGDAIIGLEGASVARRRDRGPRGPRDRPTGSGMPGGSSMTNPELPDGVTVETVYAVEISYSPEAQAKRPAVRIEHLTRVARLLREGTLHRGRRLPRLEIGAADLPGGERAGGDRPDPRRRLPPLGRLARRPCRPADGPDRP